MRKSLFGILLASTFVLPVSAVYAAGEGSTKSTYSQSQKSPADAKKAIKKGLDAGLSVEQAMEELMSEGVSAVQALTALCAAEPARAGEAVKFAMSKGVSRSVATSTAIKAAPAFASEIVAAASVGATPSEVKAIAKAAKNAGASEASITAGLNQSGFTVANAGADNGEGSGAFNGSGEGSNGVGNTTGNIGGSTGGGGGSTCDPTIATCS